MFAVAAASEGLAFILLYLFLPDYPRKTPLPGHPTTYLDAMKSTVRIAFTEPVVAQCWPLAFTSCMLAVSFWSNATFILAESPFSFTTLQIGLVSLAGLSGTLSSPISGRTTDILLHWVRIFLVIIEHQLKLQQTAVLIGTLIIVCAFVPFTGMSQWTHQ